MNNYYKISIRKTISKLLSKIDSFFGVSSPNLYVLCYHSISNDGWKFSISKEEFENQIKYLAKNFKIINADQFEKLIKNHQKPKQPSVLITFDDGYKDNLKVVSLLNKFNIQPILFVLSETKSANQIELGTSKKLLSTNEIKLLRRNGWEIGSHSATHADLFNFDTDLKKEIIDSKRQIENLLNREVKYFSYPKGRFNKYIENFITKANYSLGFTLTDGEIKFPVNRCAISRIGVDNTHDLDEFKTLFSSSVIRFKKITIKLLPNIYE